MRRRNRELQIFTLSALDVLAMSTGVFVLILVMLMPYYRKTFDAGAEIEAARVAQAETVARVRTLEEALTLHRGEASAAEAEAAELGAAAAALEEAAAADLRRARALAAGAATEERGGDVQTPIIDAIDLIFVVDATASMRPVIRAIAVSLRSVVRILESLVPSVRVGYVAYRDRDTGVAPTTTMPITATATDLERVVAFAEQLQYLTAASRTIDEDVHLGLAEAFAMRLRPEAKQSIVVVGDASVHRHLVEETLARTRSFARAGERRTVSTLFVTTPSSLSEGNRARPFFARLAEAGGGAFNEHTGSMIESVLLSVLDE
ncbi:MAG TPA: vWA domain-containing protein [Geminicoccaceae bacterium]|nr:vWA domain-containing protein [Geminicoccaceae bacterium]